MSSTRKFNWKGIYENGDGSFNVEDKRARTRLLKELHRQGLKVRSNKIEGDGYQVTPIGQGNFKASKTSAPVRSAARPRMAYSSYRRLPHRTGRMQPRLVPYPNRGSGVLGALSIANRGLRGLKNVGERMKESHRKYIEKLEKEQKERIEARKNESETNEKMKSERITQERAETVRQLERQREKQRLSNESREFEHKQAQERKAERHAEFHATRGEIRDYRQEEAVRDTHTRKQESKPDNSKLAEARQEYITGS